MTRKDEKFTLEDRVFAWCLLIAFVIWMVCIKGGA